jgi:pyruvate,water dikinase
MLLECVTVSRWGKDGNDNKLYILQARPETVQSQITTAKHEKYQLKTYSKRLTSGRAIGQKIGVGKVWRASCNHLHTL